MDIDKEKLSALAADCHNKADLMQNLHQILQKGGTPELAGKYAIARVEYQRAKNLLDLEIRNQSITIIRPVHASDCALHDGPAKVPSNCDCGAEPGKTPDEYGSEQPSRES